jgi:hypothetical protein
MWYDKRVEWMDVAQDTDQWHNVLITVSVCIPQRVGNFLSS